MNNISKKVEVVIIGGGFAGMNAACLLSKKEIRCEIYTSGFGASNLWVGTIDFLKSYINDLEEAFNQFINENPNHPYKYLDFNEVDESISNFSSEFPELYFFKNNRKVSNNLVITILGNLKPCIGVWSTIFHDVSLFNDKSSIFLIDFIEFNNSAMDLVRKSLKERYKGNFEILNLSFLELLKSWDPNIINENFPLKLSENLIANYFDKYVNDFNSLANYIISELEKFEKKLSESENLYFLFPPILGIKKNKKIIENLSHKLSGKCGELVALSPSLMSKRLIQRFEKKLENLSVKVNKGYILMNIEPNLEKDNLEWQLIFENRVGHKKIVKTKYLVLAIGSVFQEGLFYSNQIIRKNFNNLSIPFPNKMTNSYELLTDSEKHKNSNIFVCGSALYIVMGGNSDEDEIKHGTGLGLAIATSSKVANEIISRIY
ncbi:MAG: FAD-binding protein [Promethearchaeota archaeon]